MRRLTEFRLSVLFLIAILLVGSAAGCSTAKADRGDAAANTNKDELVLACGGEPTDGGFDPTAGWGRYGSPLFQSTLLARTNNLQIVNDLATVRSKRRRLTTP